VRLTGQKNLSDISNFLFAAAHISIQNAPGSAQASRRVTDLATTPTPHFPGVGVTLFTDDYRLPTTDGPNPTLPRGWGHFFPTLLSDASLEYGKDECNRSTRALRYPCFLMSLSSSVFASERSPSPLGRQRPALAGAVAARLIGGTCGFRGCGLRSALLLFRCDVDRRIDRHLRCGRSIRSERDRARPKKFARPAAGRITFIKTAKLLPERLAQAFVFGSRHGQCIEVSAVADTEH
jgi:hypothetical protein